MPRAYTVPTSIPTQRLLLARWTMNDLSTLRSSLDANQEHLKPWIPFMRAEPQSLDQTREELQRRVHSFETGAFRYALWGESSPGEPLLGEVMLIARDKGALELGYWLDHRATGQGYGREAAQALVDLAWSLDCPRVFMRCDVRNAPSIALARRLGARQEGLEHLEEGGHTVALEHWVLRP